MKKVHFELFAITALLCVFAATLPVQAAADVFEPQAQPSYLFDHSRGWFWYERHPEPVKKGKKAEKKKEDAFSFPPTNMADLKKQIKVLKERAIMHPTEKNLVAYIRVQNYLMDVSQTFAERWQQVIWTHPELDFSIAHPVNAQAIQIKQDEDSMYEHARIAHLAKDYGLFFIFASYCPYCHKEASMLKSFSQRYGISVIPISKDGKGLPEYPIPRPDTGIAAQLHVHSIPSLFLVNPKKRVVIPLAYGLISEPELIRRIISMTSDPRAAPRIGYQTVQHQGGHAQ